MYVPLLGSVLVLAGVTTSLVVSLGALQQRRAVTRSLATINLPRRAGTAPTALPFRERVMLPALARFVALGRRITPEGAREKLARRLDLAGNPTPWTPDTVLAVKAAGALLLGPTLGVLLLGGDGVARSLAAGVLGGAIGLVLPDVLLKNAGDKRQVQLRKTLPDALDLLTVSVEAGMGFDAAILHVARNTRGPLAGEFFRVLQEMQLKSRADALRALAERTDVVDLRIFVSSLVQADQLGIPIGRVLREQSREMRLKRRQRAEEQAMKVPVKILFPMVVFILPVLFVVVLAPAGMEIAQTLKGG